MVKKYKPVAFTEYSDCDYDVDSAYPACKMEQSPRGEWVTLQTYQDETARLKKQIDRLKKSQLKQNQQISIYEAGFNEMLAYGEDYHNVAETCLENAKGIK